MNTKFLNSVETLKLICCFSLLFVLGIGCISCSDDDEEDFSSYDLNTFILGEWTQDNWEGASYTFYSNGNGSYHSNLIDDKFTWTLQNGNLSTKFSDNTYMNLSHEVKILGRNKLQWGITKFTRVGDYDDSQNSEEDKPDSSDFAPTSLAGKIIRFQERLANGGGLTDNDARIEFYTEHDMRANWSSESSSYTYTKTGKNTANLNFICGQRINYVTRVFRYNVKLTFTDAKGTFKLSGTKEITGGLSGNGTYKIEGEGSYWHQLWD